MFIDVVDPHLKPSSYSFTEDIPWTEFKGVKSVGLSAGASAPEVLVNEIIEAFKERYTLSLDLVETVKEDEEFMVARDLRDTALQPADMAFVNG